MRMGAGLVRVEPLGGHRASAVPGDGHPGRSRDMAQYEPYEAMAQPVPVCPGRLWPAPVGIGRYRQAPVGLLFSRPEPVRAGPGRPESAPAGTRP